MTLEELKIISSQLSSSSSSKTSTPTTTQEETATTTARRDSPHVFLAKTRTKGTKGLLNRGGCSYSSSSDDEGWDSSAEVNPELSEKNKEK